ncbi:hypothetical protein Tco_1374424, partial [Tanacetum coccineum]
MVESEPTSKNPIKAQISRVEELAQKLFEEEQAHFEREQMIAWERAVEQEEKDAVLTDQMEDVQERMDADALFLVETIAARKKLFAAQRAAEIRNRPPTRTQLRNQMIIYLNHIGKYTYNQLKNKSFEEIQMLYKKEQQWIDDFVPMESEEGDLGEEQSAEKEKELSEEELQKMMVLVPVEEVYVEALHVKYPITDWEVYSEDTRKYWRIIRVEQPSEMANELLRKIFIQAEILR